MDNNPLSKGLRQKRSFLSLTTASLETLKNIVSQTLGKTLFDFVTFLAASREADIRAQCSNCQNGLEADLGCGAALRDMLVEAAAGRARTGPSLHDLNAAVQPDKPAVRRRCKIEVSSNLQFAGNGGHVARAKDRPLTTGSQSPEIFPETFFSVGEIQPRLAVNGTSAASMPTPIRTICDASAMPAHFASVYAPHADSQDFHPVAEVYLDGTWQVIDTTGIAEAGAMSTCAKS
ncbi:hypothetical protein [uncultured Roseobacter sp.]|uniref:hypothetical protein n=1 Tax=uncultured Roseobacter sp. TaxID=114847 RepID=UPI002608EDDE|nr:hypothetical protein [uncultured Roseobacter sp.]